MFRRLFLAAFSVVAVLAVPAAASAAVGATTAAVNMRAGPGTEFPVVTVIPASAPVEIVGCLDGWSWCDTLWAGNRGWVSGDYLNVVYAGAPVPFVAYAPRLNVPVVVYDQKVYWDRYYVGRPWYRAVIVGPNHACVHGRLGTFCR